MRMNIEIWFIARDRVELLLDEDTPFLELLPLAGYGQEDTAPGASLIAGIGIVSGVECLITSSVSTIKGGSLNESTLWKSSRIAEIGMENRLPTISLIQSVSFEKEMIFEYLIHQLYKKKGWCGFISTRKSISQRRSRF